MDPVKLAFQSFVTFDPFNDRSRPFDLLHIAFFKEAFNQFKLLQ